VASGGFHDRLKTKVGTVSTPLDPVMIKAGTVRTGDFRGNYASGEWIGFRVPFPEPFISTPLKVYRKP
jgi:hypothetical protein